MNALCTKLSGHWLMCASRPSEESSRLRLWTASLPAPLVSVALGNDVSRTRGLFIGMFATAGFTLSVLMLAAGDLLLIESHRACWLIADQRNTSSRRWHLSVSESFSWSSCYSPSNSLRGRQVGLTNSFDTLV